MSVSINGTSGLVFNDSSTQNTAATGFGFKNRIINGNMGIWQRGTSFTNISSGTYSADRYVTSTSINLTVTQDTSVPSVAYKYSLKAVPASNATATECVVRQFIEQQNVFDLSGQTVTATAWVKCSKSSVKFRCATQNATGGTDVTQTVSVTAGSWTQISYSFSTFSAVTAWTSTTNDKGGFLDIGFVDSTALTTSDYIYITGVQLEKGSTATSFDYRPYGTELALCQRYYEKSYDASVPPGSVNGNGIITYVNYATTNANYTGRYQVQKRAASSVNIYDNNTGASGFVTVGSTSTAITVTNTGMNGFTLQTNSAVGLNAISFQFAISAEF